MALVIKKSTNFASARGTPSHDTNWDQFKWDFDAMNLKVIVKQGSTADLEMSFNGDDVHAALPVPEANQNALIYDFKFIGMSRVHFRKTGADIECYAYGTE